MILIKIAIGLLAANMAAAMIWSGLASPGTPFIEFFFDAPTAMSHFIPHPVLAHVASGVMWFIYLLAAMTIIHVTRVVPSEEV